MIRMPIGPVPPDLDGADSAGARESGEAVTFYKLKKNKNKSYPFAAYKKKAVVAALNSQFGHKCAYCESFFGHVEPVDVEHYRPKGGVMVGNKLQKPGYYWLAADWNNLLPSCIDCNRKRIHQFRETGPGDRGKANLFPIADEKKRALRPGQEKRERRLLLHPYIDDPERHLAFQPDGSVKARLNGRGRESDMGRASIRVYGLDRPLLCQVRRDHLIKIRGSMQKIADLEETLDLLPAGRARNAIKRVLDAEIEVVRQALVRSQPYAGASAQVVGEFLKDRSA